MSEHVLPALPSMPGFGGDDHVAAVPVVAPVPVAAESLPVAVPAPAMEPGEGKRRADLPADGEVAAPVAEPVPVPVPVPVVAPVMAEQVAVPVAPAVPVAAVEPMTVPAAPVAPPVENAAPAPVAAPVAAAPVAVAPAVESAPAAKPTGDGPVAPTPAAAPGVQRVTDEETERITLDDLLAYMVDEGGSDLHLSAGSPPVVRIRGEVEAIPGYGTLTSKTLMDSLYSIMTTKQRAVFEEKQELDFAYTVPGKARFRVNVMQQRGSMGAVMRTIPWEIKTLEELGMPEIVGNFADLPRGFVLVTGPTGSGKSTTLAAIIDKANRTRAGHIITIEDPIEFIHQHRKSIVNQREVGMDTHSFKNALKHVLRQDPDIILVGELRDLETISVALTAAETGHLVFATLHTQSAQETITRMIDVFPPEQQQQVLTQLAASLQGVVCQTLCKTADGKGRVAALEIMVATPAIRAQIRERKLQQIQGSLQAGAQFGMQTLNQHLAELVKAAKITYDMGLEKCSDKEDFDNLVGGREAAERFLRQQQAAKNAGFGSL